MSSLEPGQVLLGKYRVEHVLGRGGMGVVLSAVHLELDVRVAIKILHGEDALNPEAAGRFLREARAASKLRSEFVARVTDFGRLADGQPFMVMDLLDGEDFEAILRRGALSPTEAVDAVLQAGAALAEAHAAGIVHRDIKPSNLFRTTRPDGSPCVKVLDFGISKVVDRLSDQPLTRTGRALGTPLYMSPEQLRTPRDIDARTDVWSLGVVLYEMLAGRPPFLAEQLGELIARIFEGTPAPLHTVRPDVPLALATVVQRCLEKDRERRVGGMRELAELLAPFASGEGGLAARRSSIGGQPRASDAPSDPQVLRASPSVDAARIASAETMDASALDVRLVTPTPVSAQSAPQPGTTDGAGSPGVEAPPRRTRSLARWTIASGAVAAIGLFGIVLATRGPSDRDVAADVDPARHPAPGSGSILPPSSELTVIPSASGLAVASATAAPSASAPPRPPGARSGPPRPRASATTAPGAPIAPRPSSTTLW